MKTTPNQWRPPIGRVDFSALRRAALGQLPDILARWLPSSRIEGREYIVRNPKRCDRRPGSFKIKLDTGRWADFATGDRGGDPISLAAYLADCNRIERIGATARRPGAGPTATRSAKLLGYVQWPDNDDGGRAYAQAVATAAFVRAHPEFAEDGRGQ